MTDRHAWTWRCLLCNVTGIARTYNGATYALERHYTEQHDPTPPPRHYGDTTREEPRP